MLFACAARAGELGDNSPALRMVRAWTRERRSREIRIAPLDREATERLARSVCSEVDAMRVFSESEGNPFFALEIARALGAGTDRIPDTIHELVAERIDRLDEHGRELVPWLAVWGRSFPPDRLPAVTELTAANVIAGIELLERHGVVRAHDALTYDFAHDVIRRAALQRVSAPRRRMMHLRIARALAEIEGVRGELAGDIARHAEGGGDAELCARACVGAGKHCLRLFAYEEAAAAIDLGCRHVARLPREARIRLHMRLLKLLEHPALRRVATRRSAEIARLCGEASEAGMASELSAGLHLLGWVHLAGGDFQSARKNAVRALDALLQRGQKDVIGLVEGARCLAILDIDVPRASAMFSDLSAFGDAAVETLSFQWGLGLVKQWEGDAQAALAALRKARAFARDARDHWAEFECLSTIAMIEIDDHKPAAVLALAGEFVPLAAKLGGGSEGAFAEALVALAQLASGDVGAGARVDQAARALERLDASFLLSYVLNGAAEITIARGDAAHARAQAERALTAASAVDRASEVARALALLAHASALEGIRAEAQRHLDAARSIAPERLSANARRIIEYTRTFMR